MTLSSAEFFLRFEAIERGSNALAAQTFSPTMEETLSFTDGTTANKADIVYAAERTVSDGANDDIDLVGSLSDAFGSTISAAEIVGVFIINKQSDGTANTTDLTIGSAANAFEGFLGGTSPTLGPISPGGVFCIVNPDADGLGTVTGASNDELRVTNGAGASNTYQIAVLARSA